RGPTFGRPGFIIGARPAPLVAPLAHAAEIAGLDQNDLLSGPAAIREPVFDVTALGLEHAQYRSAAATRQRNRKFGCVDCARYACRESDEHVDPMLRRDVSFIRDERTAGGIHTAQAQDPADPRELTRVRLKYVDRARVTAA